VTIILLDADMLLMRAATATEVEVQLGEDVWTRHSELPQAREMYWQQVESWCEQFEATLDDVWHCFTEASAFRKSLYPGYKANRASKPKPIGYKQLKAELLAEPTASCFHQIEADDLIGIFATMPEVEGESVVIASGDKDSMQIPGVHVWIDDPKKKIENEDGLVAERINGSIIQTNTPEHAERFTYQQYLSGDSTDGISGCPGLGPVGAARLVKGFDLSQPVDCWEAVVRAYEAAQVKKKLALYNASEYATQQARLARILRHGEYDFDTHKVTLWNPPTR
jgi:5'-3' exonuclease